MLHEGMKVKSISQYWSAHFPDGKKSLEIPIGMEFTVKKTYRHGSIQFVEFEELHGHGFMASGFKPFLN